VSEVTKVTARALWRLEEKRREILRRSLKTVSGGAFNKNILVTNVLSVANSAVQKQRHITLV